jgi:branched-chain amino acid transport system permease protein
VAGSLLMIQNPQATDGKFGIELAIFLVVALVIGGVATTTGAIPGALAFVFIPYYSSQWSDNFDFLKGRPGAGSIAGVFYGVLLLVFVFILPGGVIDGIRRLRARILVVAPNPSWLSQLHPKAAQAVANELFDDMAVAEPVLQQVTSQSTKETAT